MDIIEIQQALDEGKASWMELYQQQQDLMDQAYEIAGDDNERQTEVFEQLGGNIELYDLLVG